MTPLGDIIIERASIEEAEDILALQKLAYMSEAEILDDFTIPPLHQTLDKIRSEFDGQVFLKVERENRIVGSVRCYLEKIQKTHNAGFSWSFFRAAIHFVGSIKTCQ